MYPFLHDLLEDKKGGEIFRCFGPYHLLYIGLAVVAAVVICLFLRNKSREVKDRASVILIGAAFGLYMADFFLMPLAYGQIDVEKLPFHVCTAMCVMCFFSTYSRTLRPLRTHFTLLGMISNFVYLVYPAGVMWHAVHPLCYRVVQTLLFHAIMTVYGVVTLAFSDKPLTLKTWYKALAVTVGMTLWALLGNALYSGAGGYDFNWFFVLADPFGMLDPALARVVMPFLNIVIFFAVEMLVCAVFAAIKRIKKE